MPISVETIKALVNASNGNSVLMVSKTQKENDMQFSYACDFLEKLSIDCKINKSERTILMGKGEISFVPFEQARYFSKGRRLGVVFLVSSRMVE